MKGYIFFKDQGGKKCRTVLSDITSLQALGTFVTSFQSFSNAEIYGYGVMTNAEFAGSLQEGVYPSVEDKAYFTFADKTKIDDVKIKSINLPAPDDDVIEFVNGVGKRVKTSMGAALAAMLSTATGKTIVFNKGHFRAKATKSQR